VNVQINRFESEGQVRVLVKERDNKAKRNVKPIFALSFIFVTFDPFQF